MSSNSTDLIEKLQKEFKAELTKNLITQELHKAPFENGTSLDQSPLETELSVSKKKGCSCTPAMRRCPGEFVKICEGRYVGCSPDPC